MSQAEGAVIAAIVSGVVSLVLIIFTGLFGLRQTRLSADLTQRIKELEEFNRRQSELRKLRALYLDPLCVSARDLHAKFRKLTRSSFENDKWIASWQPKFLFIKDIEEEDIPQDFWRKCNGEYAGAVTMVYLTAVYFARARRVRLNMPLSKLSCDQDGSLNAHLDAVREAFGGEYNIWVELQDSIGDYVTQDSGEVMNYKLFCRQLAEPEGWFHRVVDFYGDLHLKSKQERREIIQSLERLVRFAEKVAEES